MLTNGTSDKPSGQKINVSLSNIIIAILGLLLICNDYWIFIIIIILLVNIDSFINVWFSYIIIILILIFPGKNLFTP